MNGRPQPGPAERDVSFERHWTADAAATGKVDAENLITLAETRAGMSPVRDIDARNFGHEVLEELADARNYTVWWLAQINRGAGRHPDVANDLTIAIGYLLATVAVAFAAADQAQALMADWQREEAPR